MTAEQGTGSWFSVPVPSPRAHLRLFCFPYAGGGASAYYPWARELASRAVEVCAVQLPGRENRLRESPLSSLDPVVETLTAAIRSRLDRPYCFFGHSMGALIAFELTRALRARGDTTPRELLVSGARPPHVPPLEEPLHGLDDDEAFVHALAHRYGEIPRAVLENRELLDLVLPALRADLTLIETYRHAAGPPLDCSISAFGGREDPMVKESTLIDWAAHTSSDFMWTMYPGDHFFLNTSRTALLADVMARLEDHVAHG